jgi:hypothetical protein
MGKHADTPPSDEIVLRVIGDAGAGIMPSALLKALCDLGHNDENSIRAIQRVFDRGLVALCDGAKLVLVTEPERVAA